MIVATLVAAASLAIALYLPGLPLVVVRALLLVHGIFSGTMVLCFVVAREHNRPSAGGTAVAFANMAVMGTSAAFQPLIGWLLDLGWDGRLVDGVRIYSAATFRVALSTLLVTGVAAFVAALLTRETHCRAASDAP